MDIDLDDEIGKFLTQLDLEKNSGKNVLFVQGITSPTRLLFTSIFYTRKSWSL